MYRILVIAANQIKIINNLKEKNKYFKLAIQALKRRKLYKRIALKNRNLKRHRSCTSIW